MAGFLFALLDLVHDAAEFLDVEADILADLGHLGAQFLDPRARSGDKGLPAAPGLFRHPFQPGRVEFLAAIGVDEFAPVDPRLVGELHHLRIDRHDSPVDAVKLVDQRLDPVVVQVQLVDQLHDLGAQRLIGLLVAR
jgi:hypothetical protein